MTVREPAGQGAAKGAGGGLANSPRGVASGHPVCEQGDGKGGRGGVGVVPVAKVTVESEIQGERGWVFRIAIERSWAPPNPPPPRTEHDVTLSWVDYEYWSHGAAAPEQVARMVVEALLREDPFRELPASFDASTARRWMRSLDATMETLL